MTLYQIDSEIEALLSKVDPETGEIAFNPVDLLNLQMARDEKIENTALFIKNAKAESKAIADEIKALTERKRVIDNRIENVSHWLGVILAGEKFQTAKASVSFRESKSIEVDDGFVQWAQVHASDLLRFKEPEPDKTKIKEWLRNGTEVEHAREVTNRTAVIK